MTESESLPMNVLYLPKGSAYTQVCAFVTIIKCTLMSVHFIVF